jgi:hypothetical protein
MRSLPLPSAWLLLGGLALLLAPPAARAETGTLDGELRRSAGEIHKYLRSQGYHNVGVLKFRVKRGNEEARDNVGLLNQNLANRLEVALVLTSPDESVGIIRNASAGAAKLGARASHLTADGRSQLLGGVYEPVWGDKPVKPDILLTGLAKISLNPRESVVSILAFSNRDSGSKLVALRQFTVPTDLNTVIEGGGSYIATRGFFEGAAKVAHAVQHPLHDKHCPVILDIYYGPRKVDYVFKNDHAFIEEPRHGEGPVKFVLRLRDPHDKNTYGVVLKVNGENTFYHERLPDAHCWKWILSKDWPETVVQGYQIANDKYDPFVILPDDVSAAEAIKYGKDAGQISMVVYRARDGAPPVTLVTAADGFVPRVEVGVKEAAQDVQASELPGLLPPDAEGVPIRGVNRLLAQSQEEVIRTGSLLAKAQPNLQAAKLELLKHTEVKTRSAATRGFIKESGAVAEGAIREVPFIAADEPDFVATITYYKRP